MYFLYFYHREVFLQRSSLSNASSSVRPRSEPFRRWLHLRRELSNIPTVGRSINSDYFRWCQSFLTGFCNVGLWEINIWNDLAKMWPFLYKMILWKNISYFLHYIWWWLRYSQILQQEANKWYSFFAIFDLFVYFLLDNLWISKPSPDVL